MALDISAINPGYPGPEALNDRHAPNSHQHDSPTPEEKPAKTDIPAEMTTVVRELEKIFTMFNRRLEFSINQELGEVIVKVVDTDTDKVIKEIPPKELQDLHVKFKETIGLLFDMKI